RDPRHARPGRLDPRLRTRARSPATRAGRIPRACPRDARQRPGREIPARAGIAAAGLARPARAPAAARRPFAPLLWRSRRRSEAPSMNSSMLARLEDLEQRLSEVNLQLAGEDAARDMDNFRRLAREQRELAEVVEHLEIWRQALRDAETARHMRDDPAMREFADEELADAERRIEAENAELRRLLLPRDPDDDRNVFLEVRAGTGGDESALFAGDLLRMYSRFAERQGWRVELISENASDLGGYREVIARIAGDGVFARLKFES